MGAVALDDHRASSGQSRGGIPARRGKGEREVRRTKNGHRADGFVRQAQIRTGEWRPIRKCAVFADIEIPGLFDQIGKHAQLTGGTAAFAHQARLGQSRLSHGGPGNLLSQNIHLLGNRAQESGPLGPRLARISTEVTAGGTAGVVDLRGGSLSEALPVQII